MSQPVLFPAPACPPASGPRVPTVTHDRLVRFILESIEDMETVPVSKTETVIPGTRFVVDGYAVHVGSLHCTVLKPASKGTP